MNYISKSILSEFKKNGFIYLPNFLTDDEVDKINKYRENIIVNEARDLYTISNKMLLSSKLNKSIKKIIGQKINKTNIVNLKTYADLIFYFIDNKILDKEIIDNSKDLEFDLHVAFSNTKATNYSHQCDILLNDFISQIFLKDELLNIYKALLNNEELLYWGESGFTYNKPPIRGWHSDDPINTMFKTNANTFQIRVAIYPDSVENTSGGLKLLSCSHRYNLPLQAFKNFVKYYLFREKNYKDTFKSIKLFQTQKNIFPSSRDIIIWDKRLMHSPWANMLKYFKFLNLSPQIEDYLPKKLFVSPSFPRSILSFDLGKESKDLDNYLKKWINIREDYKDYWKSREAFKKQDYLNFLNKKNIKFFEIKT